MTLAPDRDPVGILELTEPNLAFSIAARDGEHLVVRVRLSHESAPSWPWPDAWDEDGASWGSHALDAANTWQDDLTPFPHRPASTTGPAR